VRKILPDVLEVAETFAGSPSGMFLFSPSLAQEVFCMQERLELIAATQTAVYQRRKRAKTVGLHLFVRLEYYSLYCARCRRFYLCTTQAYCSTHPMESTKATVAYLAFIGFAEICDLTGNCSNDHFEKKGEGGTRGVVAKS